MKTLLYLINALLLVSIASAITQEYNLTDSQLPFATNYSVLLNSTIGTHFSLSHFDKSNEITLIFPSIYITNSSSESLNITYEIPFFVNLSDTPHVVNDSIRLTNLNTSISIDFNFLSYITYLLQNITSNQTINTSIQISGIQNFAVKTFQILLPVSFFQNITIIAQPNIQIDVTCTGNFIVCPSSFQTNQPTNTSIIPTEIRISNDTLVGNYSSFIIFKQQNSTKTVFFDIEILSGTPQVISISEIINFDKCFSSAEEFIKCKKEQSKYEAQIAQKFLDELNRQGQCTNTTEVKEKLVVVGDVNAELFKDHELLRTENRQLNEQVIESGDSLLRCNIKIENLNQIYKQDLDDITLKSINIATESKQYINEKQAKIKTNLLLSSTIFVGLLLIGYVSYRYWKLSWGAW